MPDFAGGAGGDPGRLPRTSTTCPRPRSRPASTRRRSASSACSRRTRSRSSSARLPTNLVPNRDLGFMLWGQPFYGALEYELGDLQRRRRRRQQQRRPRLQRRQDFAGRIFVLAVQGHAPWEARAASASASPAPTAAARARSSNPGLPQYKTDAQQNFFTYVANSPATAAGTAFANGRQWRITPQGYWYWGPFGFLWEWAQSNNDVSLNGNTPDHPRQRPGRRSSRGC